MRRKHLLLVVVAVVVVGLGGFVLARSGTGEPSLDCPSGMAHLTMPDYPAEVAPDDGYATHEEVIRSGSNPSDVEVKRTRDGESTKPPEQVSKDQYIVKRGDRVVSKFDIEQLSNGRYVMGGRSTCSEDLQPVSAR